MKQLVGIPEFFAGKTVLVTGGTGFVGKCLVEKLLRDCPEVKKILLIIRGRNGESSQERFEQYFASAAFDRIRENLNDWRDRLGLIPGDITLPNCGLFPDDLDAIRSVQVVIHSAATISFHMRLAKIVKLNVGGTKNVLDLALTMPGIQAFVYISTAYCMPSNLLVEEKVYPTELNPQEALTTFQSLPEDWMATLTPIITGKRNTYQYSKHMAEKLVESYKEQLPVAIVRPGATSYQEPFPGWNDTESMMSVYFNLMFRGDAGSILADTKVPLVCTPADVAVNTVLAAAWTQAAQISGQGCNVYNCVPLLSNLLWQKDLREFAYQTVRKNPSSSLVWYPWSYVTNTKLLFTLRLYFFRGVPALFADLCGFKSHGTSNMAMLKRMKQLITVYASFASVKREFTTENMKILNQTMSPDDRKTFPVDMGAISWKKFMQNFAQGLDKFGTKKKSETSASSCQMLRLKGIYYMMETTFFALLIITPALVMSQLGHVLGFFANWGTQMQLKFY